MLPTSYNEYLYRTSLERVAHGRTSRTTSDQLLEKARATLERSRLQVSGHVYVEPEATLAPAPVQRQAPELMEAVSGRTFDGEHVVLDGKHFADCILRNCVLEYSGLPVVLETTQFAGCRFQFNGAAAMTMQLMECLRFAGEGAPEPHDPATAVAPQGRPN